MTDVCVSGQDVNAQPRPTAQDLAGFWDLLQLSIEDISMKFDELHLLKSNDWKMSETQDKKVQLTALMNILTFPWNQLNVENYSGLWIYFSFRSRTLSPRLSCSFIITSRDENIVLQVLLLTNSLYTVYVESRTVAQCI